MHLIPSVDTANSEDPTEISFAKGEILDIVDKQGKWWQSRRADGSTGSAFLTPFITIIPHSFLLPFRSRTIQLSTNHLKKIERSVFFILRRDLSYLVYDNNEQLRYATYTAHDKLCPYWTFLLSFLLFYFTWEETIV